ncbi:hypothetical protein MtrunA17_Chr5g0428411 [Medicago truncatula]|uniref:Uncharacterized protein n=1 Tax=Medicago truncatula TaxID=3880 RepID=A0A396HSM2_MEDTR|nr:hypothetical protein MtrunA17_Chr5g0428411 [Medicago truncatula]
MMSLGRTEGDSSSSNFKSSDVSAMYPELFEDDPVFQYLRETAKKAERERLHHMHKPVETTKIPVGQIVEKQVTINGNVELQRIYVPDPKVRETMEYMVKIAWERQSSNQPLRSQDRMAIDYYNAVLRHLPQPINGPNQPVLPHLQQSNYHAQNEVFNIVYFLSSKQINI